jgi:hypothetical protein
MKDKGSVRPDAHWEKQGSESIRGKRSVRPDEHCMGEIESIRTGNKEKKWTKMNVIKFSVWHMKQRDPQG